MDDSQGWPREVAERVGEAVRSAREERGMSYVRLAEATEKIGAPVHRVAIPRIEKGEQGVTLPELIALGVALEADWSKWLDRATAGVDIPGARSDRAVLRMLIAEVEEKLQTQRHNLFQAEEGPKRLNVPDQYRERLAEEAEHYRELIKSLEDALERYKDDLRGMEDDA
ncbi:helix-turn-helix domain-containing protein [Mycobacterium timonense]|nr:helix-turn-helix transcriptional regulator [Mycobacterium timonense]